MMTFRISSFFILDIEIGRRKFKKREIYKKIYSFMSANKNTCIFLLNIIACNLLKTCKISFKFQ